MNKKITLAVLSLAAFLMVSAGAFAQGSAARFVKNQLKTDSLFTHSVVGIKAVNEHGKVIAEWNSTMPLLTASTMKTLTTGMGLKYLGKDFRYETKVVYSGKVSDGVLYGDIIIVGGGDPTLGSKDTLATPIDKVFGEWAEGMKKAGINKITGNIVVDDSYFVREQMPDSWSWGDFGEDYGAAPSGLTFCENCQELEVIPGEKEGDPVQVNQVYPVVPGLKIVNKLTTGGEKDGNEAAYYVQDFARCASYEGQFGRARKVYHPLQSCRFPQLACGNEFAKFLLAKGFQFNGEIVDITEYAKKDYAKAAVEVAKTYSPELWRIVLVTNRISQNLFAETILKTIGKVLAGEGSYDAALDKMYELYKENGISTFGFRQADGSGLSRKDHVSPTFFCNYYNMMAKSDVFPEFFLSLPVPGHGGTLKSVLNDEPASLKERVHAKSGSLNGVRCYAGYVQAGKKNGLIRFAILTNHYCYPTSAVQPKIEGFLKALAQED